MGLLSQLTRRLSDVAALALVAMILLTIADILMKNIFHQPIRGTFEVVEFMMVVAVFFGLAEVFRSQSNISVDVIDHVVKGRASTAITVFSALATLLFLLILGWAMLAPAWDTIFYPQNTQEAGIPMFAYWLPILAGTALTIVATCMAALLNGRKDSAGGEF